MKRKSIWGSLVGLILVVAAPITTGGSTAVGAAPKGDATAVASRIIKYNFPKCRHVSSAVRAPDGSIRARCDGTDYIVFTLFNAKEGKLHELALNCAASKKLLDVSC